MLDVDVLLSTIDIAFNGHLSGPVNALSHYILFVDKIIYASRGIHI